MTGLALSGRERGNSGLSRDAFLVETAETPEDQRRRLRQRQNRLHASQMRAYTIVAITLICVALVLYGPDLYRLTEMRSQISEIKAECGLWQDRNTELRSTVSHMMSDEFVRRAAREQLGLVDHNAKLYIATLPDEAAQGSSKGLTAKDASTVSLALGH